MSTRKEYKYSINNDVDKKQFNINILKDEIQSNFNYTDEFEGICQNGDDITIIFSNELNVQDETSLGVVVLNHQADTYVKKNHVIPFYPINPVVSESNYTSIGSFTLSISNVLTGIDIISRMSTGATSYDILILNHDTNQIIAEQNFTNTDIKTSSFLNINNNTNLNSNKSFLVRVFAKINKNGKSQKNVFVENIMFWY